MEIIFTAEIKQHYGLDAAYVEFPFSVEEVFHKKSQVKVKAIFGNGTIYRGSLSKMGQKHFLILTKAIRKEIDKTFGDTIEIRLIEDLEERIVTIAEDIQQILDDNPEAKLRLEKMSYTHRKEYIRWIEEAKKTETRERRKMKMIEMIMSGKKGI